MTEREKMNYINVPENLDERMLIAEFGVESVQFYKSRILERKRCGRKYPNPLKTIYIWATQDRNTNQGFYTTWRGFRNSRKKKNYGGS